MAVDHYENFPVASLLLPAHLRRAVKDIYRFARGADDIADEGEASPSERLEALKIYRSALQDIASGHPPPEDFRDLAHTIDQHALPLQPFFDLLDAFEQDIEQTRYPTYAVLLDYCRRSANPIGSLMLVLYNANDSRSLEQSAAICSSLQLINFLQDVAIDWDKDRVYLPQEDLLRFGVSLESLSQGRTDAAWCALMQFEVDRCRELLNSGSGLGRTLSGRIGLELRLIIQGGLRILEKIEYARFDVFRHRPSLNAFDWVIMFWRALRA